MTAEQFSAAMNEPRELTLTRQQCEMIHGMASARVSELWRNGKPAPGHERAKALADAIGKQHPDCMAACYAGE